MKRLEISVEADADLFDILAFGTAVHGHSASDIYYDGLITCFNFLCERPYAGPVEEASVARLRRWRFKQHRIFYRVDEDSIVIIRIFHLAADAVRWMND